MGPFSELNNSKNKAARSDVTTWGYRPTRLLSVKPLTSGLRVIGSGLERREVQKIAKMSIFGLFQTQSSRNPAGDSGANLA